MRLSRLGRTLLVLSFAAALVALPMLASGRGTRALAFGWLVFAALAAAARPPREEIVLRSRV